MFSTINRCAERTFDQGHFKVKVKHTVVTALYHLKPWWDLQITHKCQV